MYNGKINMKIKKLLLSLILSSVFISAYAQTKDALVLYQHGRYRESIQVCEEELQDNPNRIESYVVMCWSLVENKQYAEAEQRAQTGLKISPYELRLIEILAEAQYYQGKNNAALEQFELYVSNAKENAGRYGKAYYFMGEIYIKLARYQHADIALSTAVKLEPMIDNWWVRLGFAREMAGNYAESIAAYDEALRLNGSNVDATQGKSRVSAQIR